jgi:DNA-binding CsgD family transcriptional regulator
MAAKTLHQALTELRALADTRQRRARNPDAASLIVRILAPCRTSCVEHRLGGLAFRLHGNTENAAPFSITCVLHHPEAVRALTTAEQAVADQLCEGRTLGQIASLRGVSANTVKSQVRQIFRKLNVDSRVALVRRLCP